MTDDLKNDTEELPEDSSASEVFDDETDEDDEIVDDDEVEDETVK